MKKLILVLAICLIASPVFAVSVFVEKQAGVNVLDVKYTGNGTTAATRIRGLAITLTLDGTGTFNSISNFKTGESTASSRGYGIYPATIVIDSAGVVTNAGSPQAAVGDPGAGPALPAGTVVLEFGSLYFADANAPGASGTLCSIAYTPGTATQVTVAAEATYRGGIVMEDGSQSNGSVVSPFILPPDVIIPGAATNGTPQPNVTGLAVTLGWTAGANATSYDVSFGTVNPPPFFQNVAGTSVSAGTLVQGKTYYVSVLSKNGTTPAASALTWSFSTDCLKSTDPGYAAWVGGGSLPWAKPSCWCYQRQCRGEVNNNKQGSFWVYTQDLAAMKDAYGKLDAQLTGNRICSDINHAKQGSFRVYTQDLTTLKAYYGKLDAQNPICPTTHINFWTN